MRHELTSNAVTHRGVTWRRFSASFSVRREACVGETAVGLRTRVVLVLLTGGRALTWLLLGHILCFCLLWFGGKSPLNCKKMIAPLSTSTMEGKPFTRAMFRVCQRIVTSLLCLNMGTMRTRGASVHLASCRYELSGVQHCFFDRQSRESNIEGSASRAASLIPTANLSKVTFEKKEIGQTWACLFQSSVFWRNYLRLYILKRELKAYLRLCTKKKKVKDYLRLFQQKQQQNKLGRARRSLNLLVTFNFGAFQTPLLLPVFTDRPTKEPNILKAAAVFTPLVRQVFVGKVGVTVSELLAYFGR